MEFIAKCVAYTLAGVGMVGFTCFTLAMIGVADPGLLCIGATLSVSAGIGSWFFFSVKRYPPL